MPCTTCWIRSPTRSRPEAPSSRLKTAARMAVHFPETPRLIARWRGSWFSPRPAGKPRAYGGRQGVVSISARRGGRVRPPLDWPGLTALVLGLAGVGYRLALLLLGVPGTNSDEAMFGLAAMHIAQGRAAPIYMYGQHYMGTVESYLAAPLFAAFEPSWLLLRIPVLALYAVFVFLMYRMTRRLYSPWLAVFVVGLLALGSERVIRDQVTAVGGRPESKPAMVALLLIAVALGERRVRHRALALGAFGLLAGLPAWDDWLVLPYLAVAGLVLIVGSGRDLLGRGGALAVAGF